jgi:hypothetical protein
VEQIMLGFYFIVARVETVYEVTLPWPVRRAFSILVTISSLGLNNDVTVLTCIGINGFLHRLVFWILAPFVLVGAMVLGAFARLLLTRRHCSPVELFYASLPLIARLLFFLYPILTNVAFEAFSCYEFDSGNTSRLIADVNIDCNQRDEGSEYARVLGVAWAAIAVHQFGLLTAFLTLLLLVRRAITSGAPTRLSMATSFLHREVRDW